MRMRTKDGAHSSLLRLWAAKDRDRWLCYDWEDVDRIFRTSTNLAMTLASLRGNVEGTYLQALLSAARFTGEGNDALAERILSQLAGFDLGEALEATRWLLVAKVRIGQGHGADAVAALDRAAKLNPEIPSLAGLRAAAWQKQGDSARAITFAKEALDLLGPDAHTYAILGDALIAQGKPAEAVEAYRNGLACQPNLMDNLVGLARALPNEKREEVGEFLRNGGEMSLQEAQTN